VDDRERWELIKRLRRFRGEMDRQLADGIHDILEAFVGSDLPAVPETQVAQLIEGWLAGETPSWLLQLLNRHDWFKAVPWQHQIPHPQPLPPSYQEGESSPVANREESHGGDRPPLR
jgi:hypothetical protein